MIEMMDYIYYIIWFHKAFGTTARGRKVLAYYKGDYEALYMALFHDREDSGFTDGDRDKLIYHSAIDSDFEAVRCNLEGWHAVSCLSEYYPKELLKIKDYPHVLFCDGDIEVLKGDVKFAVVGSRDAHEDARVAARNAAYNLAKSGSVIVSGAALGIDSAAHLGAIEANGSTVGVLGCGLGSRYMKNIGDLYDRIKKNGVFITEMLPDANPARYTFAERNRIISGMSNAVLVAGADKGSGALITATHAKKQGRRVFAMSPEIAPGEGCKSLIAEGATVFYNAGDMVYPMRELFPEGALKEEYLLSPVSAALSSAKSEVLELPVSKTPRRKKSVSEKTSSKKTEKADKGKKANEDNKPSETVLPEDLSEEAVKLYGLIGEEAIGVDELVKMTGFSASRVLVSVSELESELLITVLPGNRVVRS